MTVSTAAVWSWRGGMLVSTGRPGAFTLEVKLATVILGEGKALEALVEVSVGSPKEV